MGEEHLGVFIGADRVAVDEEHGPDRWVGRHIKERATAESWVDHLAESGEASMSQPMEKSAEKRLGLPRIPDLMTSSTA